MTTDLHDISVICETFRADEVNAFLALGWKVLETSSGYFLEENLEYREPEKVGRFTYSLGWFGAEGDAQYPKSYTART